MKQTYFLPKNAMRVILLLALFTFSHNLLFAQTTILTVNFETNGENYTVSPAESNANISNPDYWIRTNGTTPTIYPSVAFTNIEGSYFFTGEDLDYDSGATQHLVTCSAVDVSSYTSLQIKLLVAGAGFNYNKEGEEYFKIEYQYDGGGYTTLAQFLGNGPYYTEDANADGTVDGSDIGTTLTEFTYNIPSSGTSLQVRFEMYNGGSEEFAFDDVRILGTEVSDPATSTFTGTGNWSDEANWSDGLPGATTDVTITGACMVDGSYACNNLTIKSSATSSGSLLGQENLTVNGTLTVESYLTGNAWHLVSSPAPGETISNFLSSNSNIPTSGSYRGMMDYNEASNNWNTFFTDTESGSLTSGKGFSLRTDAGGVVTYTGTLATGTVSPTVARTGYSGWNCVGNPYPSAIFINHTADASNNFITVNIDNFDPSFAAVYVWEEGSGAYTIIGQDETAYYAQSGQAFMVKVNTDVTSLDFTQAMQTAQPSLTIKSGNSAWSLIELIASQEDKSRSAKIRFNDDMTTGLDVGYDAGVFKTGFDIYTRLLEDNGIDFGLQSLPGTGMEEYVIPVGIDAAASGEISFSLKSENLPSGITPILNDNVTGISFPFNSEEDVYTTTISESTGYGRFTLTFSSTTAVDDILSGESHFKAWYSNGSIYISGEMDGTGEATVYDVNGRKVAIHQLSSSTRNRIDAPEGASSLYLVRISDSKRSEVLKVPVSTR